MKKRAILIVGLALLMATAGVVYAHWTDTLTVNATVATGSVNVRWINIFTDDDGGPGYIGVTAQHEEDNGTGAVYTFGQATSKDPSDVGSLTVGVTRYDKDVADCFSGIPVTAVGEGMSVNVSNAYPSYHCTIWSIFENQGTVPVKVEHITNYMTRNGVALGLCSAVGYPCVGAGTPPYQYAIYGPTGVAEAEWGTLAGTVCGFQLDPSIAPDYVQPMTVNTLHVLQGDFVTPLMGNQGATYGLQQRLDWVNWNESSYPTPIEDGSMPCLSFTTTPIIPIP